MKKQSSHLAPKSATSVRLLDRDQLANVTGGGQIVSPRDPASGLPTGK